MLPRLHTLALVGGAAGWAAVLEGLAAPGSWDGAQPVAAGATAAGQSAAEQWSTAAAAAATRAAASASGCGLRSLHLQAHAQSVAEVPGGVWRALAQLPPGLTRLELPYNRLQELPEGPYLRELRVGGEGRVRWVEAPSGGTGVCPRAWPASEPSCRDRRGACMPRGGSKRAQAAVGLTLAVYTIGSRLPRARACGWLSRWLVCRQPPAEQPADQPAARCAAPSKPLLPCVCNTNPAALRARAHRRRWICRTTACRACPHTSRSAAQTCLPCRWASRRRRRLGRAQLTLRRCTRCPRCACW